MTALDNKDPIETGAVPKSFLELITEEANNAISACLSTCNVNFVNTPFASIYQSLQSVAQEMSAWINECERCNNDFIDVKEKGGTASRYLLKELAIQQQLGTLHSEFTQGKALLEMLSLAELKQRLLKAINDYMASAGFTSVQNVPGSPLDRLAKATDQHQVVEAIMAFNTELNGKLPRDIVRDAMNVTSQNMGPGQPLYTYVAYALDQIQLAQLAIEARQEEEVKRDMRTITKLMTSRATNSASDNSYKPNVATETLTSTDKEGGKFIQRINIEDKIFCDIHIEKRVVKTTDVNGLILKQVVFRVVRIDQVNPKKELQSLKGQLAASPIILTGKNEIEAITIEILKANSTTRIAVEKIMSKQPAPPKTRAWTRMHTAISGIGAGILAIVAGLTTHSNTQKAPASSHRTASHRAPTTPAVTRHTSVVRPATPPSPLPLPTAQTHVDQTPVQAPTSIVLQSFSPRSESQANPELALRKMLEGYQLPQSAAHIANTLTSQRPESLLSQARNYANGDLANAYATHRPDARLNTWLRGGHRIHTHVGDTFQLQQTGATVSLVHNDARGVTLYSLPLPITLPSAAQSVDQAASQPVLERYIDASSAEYMQLMDMHTDRSDQSRLETKTYTELTPALVASIDAQVSAGRTATAPTKTYMDPSSAAYQELMASKAPRYADETQRSMLIKQLDQKRTLSQRIRGFLSSILS